MKLPNEKKERRGRGGWGLTMQEAGMRPSSGRAASKDASRPHERSHSATARAAPCSEAPPASAARAER